MPAPSQHQAPQTKNRAPENSSRARAPKQELQENSKATKSKTKRPSKRAKRTEQEQDDQEQSAKTKRTEQEQEQNSSEQSDHATEQSRTAPSKRAPALRSSIKKIESLLSLLSLCINFLHSVKTSKKTPRLQKQSKTYTCIRLQLKIVSPEIVVYSAIAGRFLSALALFAIYRKKHGSFFDYQFHL